MLTTQVERRSSHDFASNLLHQSERILEHFFFPRSLLRQFFTLAPKALKLVAHRPNVVRQCFETLDLSPQDQLHALMRQWRGLFKNRHVAHCIVPEAHRRARARNIDGVLAHRDKFGHHRTGAAIDVIGHNPAALTSELEECDDRWAVCSFAWRLYDLALYDEHA